MGKEREHGQTQYQADFIQNGNAGEQYLHQMARLLSAGPRNKSG
jgi:hypothetical protein